MAEAFAELQGQDSANDLGHAEWLALLLDRETANRTTKRFKTRLRAARLRHAGAAIEDMAVKVNRISNTSLYATVHVPSPRPVFP
jgi:hypothetical protein